MALVQNQDSQAASAGSRGDQAETGSEPVQTSTSAELPAAAAQTPAPQPSGELQPKDRGATKAERAAPAGPGPAAQTSVAAVQAGKAGRNVIKLDIPRSAVKQIKVVDTDLVLILDDGRTVYVRDGAVQAMIDQDFAVQFADSVETSGQDLLHSAEAADVGRIAITGAAGEDLPGAVTTEAPSVAVPAAAPEARRGGKWQTYALIGAPLVGGALAGTLGGKSSSAASTSTTTTPQAVKTAVPVIAPVNGTNVVNKASKDAGVTVKGTAEAGATVTVVFGTAQKTATADSSGNWSVQYSASEVPADAAQVGISATAKASGSLSSDPATRDVRVDTTPPDTPIIYAVTGDNQLNPTEQTGPVDVTGLSEAGATVKVQWGAATKLAVADAAGVWKATFAVGEYPSTVGGSTVTAVATDTAGNVGTQASLAVTINPQVDVVGFVAAGKLLSGNGLVVSIYAADGKTLLASNIKVSSNGSFTATGLAAAPGDAVIAIVSDTNDAADYLDEATGLAKSLGSAKLLATGIVAGGGSVVLNVNPMTTMAAQLAGLSEEGVGSITAKKVSDANLAVAKALGLGSIDITQLTPVTTNGGQFNTKDGVSIGEKAGALLAALSGGDLLNGGSIAKTIASVLGELVGGKLSVAGQQLLMQGAVKAAAQGDGALQSLVSEILVQSAAATKFTIDTVAGDNIVSASEIVGLAISGTVAAGAKAVVLHLGALNVNATISGATWSYQLTASDLAALGTGVTVISADATLGDGSTVAASRPVAIYTTLPLKPTIDPLGGDSYINAVEAGQGLTITGTGTVGTKITLTWAKTGAPVTTTVGADGRWNIAYLPADIPQDADNLVTVTATDQFGNVSEAVSAPLHYDVVAPVKPGITALNAANKIGLSALTDGVTFTGSGVAGEFIALTFGSYAAPAVQVGANGQWAVSVPGTKLPPDGVQSVSVKQFDLAGNYSAASQMQVTVSTARPPAPKFTTVAGGDNYVNANEAKNGFTIKGTGVAGQTVYVKLGSDAENFTPSKVVSADGTWSIFFSASTPKAGILPDTPAGTPGYALVAWADDGQGTLSEITTGPNVTFDTQINVPTITPPSGADKAFLIGKSAREAGYTVSGTCDADVTKVVLTFIDPANPNHVFSYNGLKTGSTTWSATISASDALDSGSWRVTVTVTDRAGNSATSAAATAVVDTLPPAPPTIDAGLVDGGLNITKDLRTTGLTLLGKAESLSTVTISWVIGGQTFKQSTVVASTGGAWIYKFGEADYPALAGIYELHLSATDKFGNTSTDQVYGNINLTGQTLPGPKITAVASDDPSITLPDGYINGPASTKAIKVRGTVTSAPAGSKVKVTWNGATDSGAPDVPAVVIKDDGTWEATFAAGVLTFATGTTVLVHAQVIDPLGNYSADATKALIIDTYLQNPSFTLINGEVPSATQTINYASLDSLVVKVSGIDPADSVSRLVRLKKGAVTIDTAVLTADPGGDTWSAQFSQLLDRMAAALGKSINDLSAFNGNDYTFVIEVQDAAGNSRVQQSQQLNVVLNAPTVQFDGDYAPIANAALGGYYLSAKNITTTGNLRKVTISGKGAGAQSKVSISLDLVNGKITGDATADDSGNWTVSTETFASALLPESGTASRQLTITLTDAAGNSAGPQGFKVYADTVINQPVVASVDGQTAKQPAVGTGVDYYYVNKSTQEAGQTKIKLAVDSDFASVTLTINGQVVNAVKEAGSSAWTVILPIDKWPTADGLINATLTATDAAGNTATSTVPLWFDRTPPAGAVTITSFNGAALKDDPFMASTQGWVLKPGASGTKAQFIVAGTLSPELRTDLGGFVRLTFTSKADATKSFTFDSARLSDPTVATWNVPVALDDDLYTLTYTFIDEAQNAQTPATYTKSIGVDHLTPTPPSTTVNGLTDNTVPNAWFTDKTKKFTYTVTTEAYAFVSIQFKTDPPATGYANADGVCTLEINSDRFLDPGAGQVSNVTSILTITDRAGNMLANVQGPVFTVYGGTPLLDVEAVSANKDDVVSKAELANLSFRGNLGNPNGPVQVTLHYNKKATETQSPPDIVAPAIKVGATWTLDLTAAQKSSLIDGSWTLTITAPYATGERTATRNFTVFTTLTPTLTSAAHGFQFSKYDIDNGFSFTGTGTLSGDKVTVTLYKKGATAAGDTWVASQSNLTVNPDKTFSGNFAPNLLVAGATYYLSVVETSDKPTAPEANTSATLIQTLTYATSNPTAKQILVYATDPAADPNMATIGNGTLLIGQTVYLRLEMSEKVQLKQAGSPGTIALKLNTGATVTFKLGVTGTYLYATYTVKPGESDVAQLGLDTSVPLTISNLKSMLDVDLSNTALPTFQPGLTLKVDANRSTALDTAQPLLLPPLVKGGANAAVTTPDGWARFQIDYSALAGKTFTVGDTIQIASKANGKIYASIVVTTAMLSGVDPVTKVGTWAGPANQPLVLTASQALPAGSADLVLRVADPVGNITPLDLPGIKPLTVTVAPTPKDTTPPQLDLNGSLPGTDSRVNPLAGSMANPTQIVQPGATLADTPTANTVASSGIASITLKVDGSLLMPASPYTLVPTNQQWLSVSGVTDLLLNGKPKSDGLGGTSATWAMDGSDIGAGKLTFTLNGVNWQVTWDPVARQFSFAVTDAMGRPTTTDAGNAQALITALRFADPNTAQQFSYPLDGDRRFVFTVTDGAGNATSATANMVINAQRPQLYSVGVISKNGTTQYVLTFSEAVRVDLVKQGLAGIAALGAVPIVVEQNSFTLADLNGANAAAYASTFLLTLGAGASAVPGDNLAGNVSPDPATGKTGHTLGTVLKLGAQFVVGTGGADDNASTDLTFVLPTAYINTQLVDRTIVGVAGSESLTKPFSFINASEKAAGVRLNPTQNGWAGVIKHTYLNGVEVSAFLYGGYGATLPDGSTAPGTNGTSAGTLNQIGDKGIALTAYQLGRDGVKTYSVQPEFPDGSKGQFQDNRKFMLDSTAPTVKQISYSDTNGNGTIDHGDTLRIDFKEAVNLGAGALTGMFGNGATAVALAGFTELTGTYNGATPAAASDSYATSWLVTLGADPNLSGGSPLSFTAGKVTDLAGNPLTATYAVPTDLAQRPTAITIKTVSGDNVINAAEAKNATSIVVTVSGAKDGDVVALMRDGVQVGTTSVQGDGTQDVTFSLAAGQWGGDGEHALTATVQRPANGSVASASTVSSPLRTVTVAAQITHWSELYANTLWFDPDTLSGTDGDPITDWAGKRWTGSAALSIAAKNTTGFAQLARDPAGHLRLYFNTTNNGLGFNTDSALSLNLSRPSKLTGYALFSLSQSTGDGGAVLTTYVTDGGADLSTVALGVYGTTLGKTDQGSARVLLQYSGSGGGFGYITVPTVYTLGLASGVWADQPTASNFQPALSYNMWSTYGLNASPSTVTGLVDGYAVGSKPTANMTFNSSNANAGRPYLTIGSSSFGGMVADQILFQNQLSQAMTDEINTYLAVKYQTVGSPIPVSALADTYDLTTNAPAAGTPVLVDDILQLGQSSMGVGNDTIITAGPDYVNAGAGNDLVRTTDLRFRVLDGGIGFDTFALDPTYRNAISGFTFNLSDYVSNARGVSGNNPNDTRVNGNGFHKLQGFEKLDFSLAQDSQTVKLSLTDIDMLADKTMTGDPYLPSNNLDQSNLYLVLGSNDWLDPTGLGLANQGYWLGPDGVAYSRRYEGVAPGTNDPVKLFVRGGASGIGLSSAPDAVVRDAGEITLRLDQTGTLGSSAGSDWQVVGATFTSATLVGSTLTLKGTGFDGLDVLTISYKGTTLTNGNGEGLRYTTFAIGSAGNDTLDYSGWNSAVAILAGSGNDVLKGGASNDLLVSGAGNDTMTGGTGADVFRIVTNDLGRDTITDFRINQGDQLDLRALLSNAPLGSLFNADGTFNSANGNLKLTGVAGTSDAILWVDTGGYGNVNSATTPYSILLQNVSTSAFSSSTSDASITFLDSGNIQQTRTLAQLIQDQVVLVA